MRALALVGVFLLFLVRGGVESAPSGSSVSSTAPTAAAAAAYATGPKSDADRNGLMAEAEADVRRYDREVQNAMYNLRREHLRRDKAVAKVKEVEAALGDDRKRMQGILKRLAELQSTLLTWATASLQQRARTALQMKVSVSSAEEARLVLDAKQRVAQALRNVMTAHGLATEAGEQQTSLQSAAGTDVATEELIRLLPDGISASQRVSAIQAELDQIQNQQRQNEETVTRAVQGMTRADELIGVHERNMQRHAEAIAKARDLMRQAQENLAAPRLPTPPPVPDFPVPTFPTQPQPQPSQQVQSSGAQSSEASAPSDAPTDVKPTDAPTTVAPTDVKPTDAPAAGAPTDDKPTDAPAAVTPSTPPPSESSEPEPASVAPQSDTPSESSAPASIAPQSDTPTDVSPQETSTPAPAPAEPRQQLPPTTPTPQPPVQTIAPAVQVTGGQGQETNAALVRTAGRLQRALREVAQVEHIQEQVGAMHADVLGGAAEDLAARGANDEALNRTLAEVAELMALQARIAHVHSNVVLGTGAEGEAGPGPTQAGLDRLQIALRELRLLEDVQREIGTLNRRLVHGGFRHPRSRRLRRVIRELQRLHDLQGLITQVHSNVHAAVAEERDALTGLSLANQTQLITAATAALGALATQDDSAAPALDAAATALASLQTQQPVPEDGMASQQNPDQAVKHLHAQQSVLQNTLSQYDRQRQADLDARQAIDQQAQQEVERLRAELQATGEEARRLKQKYKARQQALTTKPETNGQTDADQSVLRDQLTALGQKLAALRAKYAAYVSLQRQRDMRHHHMEVEAREYRRQLEDQVNVLSQRLQRAQADLQRSGVSVVAIPFPHMPPQQQSPEDQVQQALVAAQAQQLRAQSEWLLMAQQKLAAEQFTERQREQAERYREYQLSLAMQSAWLQQQPPVVFPVAGIPTTTVTVPEIPWQSPWLTQPYPEQPQPPWTQTSPRKQTGAVAPQSSPSAPTPAPTTPPPSVPSKQQVVAPTVAPSQQQQAGRSTVAPQQTAASTTTAPPARVQASSTTTTPAPAQLASTRPSTPLPQQTIPQQQRVSTTLPPKQQSLPQQTPAPIPQQRVSTTLPPKQQSVSIPTAPKQQQLSTPAPTTRAPKQQLPATPVTTAAPSSVPPALQQQKQQTPSKPVQQGSSTAAPTTVPPAQQQQQQKQQTTSKPMQQSTVTTTTTAAPATDVPAPTDAPDTLPEDVSPTPSTELPDDVAVDQLPSTDPPTTTTAPPAAVPDAPEQGQSTDAPAATPVPQQTTTPAPAPATSDIVQPSLRVTPVYDTIGVGGASQAPPCAASSLCKLSAPVQSASPVSARAVSPAAVPSSNCAHPSGQCSSRRKARLRG